MVHTYSMAGHRHALTRRTKGQRSRTHGYEYRHRNTFTIESCPPPLLRSCAAATAGVGLHVVWLLSFLVHLVANVTDSFRDINQSRTARTVECTDAGHCYIYLSVRVSVSCTVQKRLKRSRCCLAADRAQKTVKLYRLGPRNHVH